MLPITLSFGEVEKTLAAWGFGSDPRLRLRTRGVSTFTVFAPGADPASGPGIPFLGQVTVWYGRKLPALVGGRIIFQGRLIQVQEIAEPDRRGVLYIFGDAWWDLEKIVFQQQWKAVAIGANPQLVDSAFSRVLLFQDFVTGRNMKVADQVSQIITYAQSCAPGAHCQLGACDITGRAPFYQAKAISCADALLLCLRLFPDSTTWFDYSTSPPTLNIVQRAGSAVPVTLPFAGADPQGRRHKSSRIRPLFDMQVSQVVLQYTQTNTETIGGVNSTWTTYNDDVWPPGSKGNAIQALVAAIDLQGLKVSALSAALDVAAFDPSSLVWWQSKKQAFNQPGKTTKLKLLDATINGDQQTHPQGITVTDDEGVAIDLPHFPNELMAGSVAPWMSAKGKQVLAANAIVTGWLSWEETGPAGVTTRKVAQKQVSCKVRLTNSRVGTGITYNALQSVDYGEVPVVGLAQALYQSWNPLQFEGEHVVTEYGIFQFFNCGNVVNLSGGSPDWSAMAAVVSQVDIDLLHGRTALTFGPAKHLDPVTWSDALQWFRFRYIYENPATRITGRIGGGSGSQSLGKETQRENTNEGLAQNEVQGVMTTPAPDGSVLKALFDAGGTIIPGATVGYPAMAMHKVDSTGAPIVAFGGMLLDLAKLNGHTLKIREKKICHDDGTLWYCRGLFSEDYAVSEGD